MEQFRSFDWELELRLCEQSDRDGSDYCDPGVGLVREDANILHLCPKNSSVAAVFYHYRKPERLFGIFPYLSSETVHAHDFPLKNCRELFSAHFDQNQEHTLQLLAPYQDS